MPEFWGFKLSRTRKITLTTRKITLTTRNTIATRTIRETETALWLCIVKKNGKNLSFDD